MDPAELTGEFDKALLHTAAAGLFDARASIDPHAPLTSVGDYGAARSRGIARSIKSIMRQYPFLTWDGFRSRAWSIANPDRFARDRCWLLDEDTGSAVIDVLVFLVGHPVPDGICSWDLRTAVAGAVKRHIPHGAAIIGAIMGNLQPVFELRAITCLFTRCATPAIHPAFPGCGTEAPL